MIPLLIVGALAVNSLSKKPEKVKTSLKKNWNFFDSLFQKYGRAYNVDWKLLKAIALNESSLGTVQSVALGLLKPSEIDASKSSDGKSWGLMQVTLTTARELDSGATEEKLNNAEYSIKLSAQYFSILQKLFSQYDIRYTEWVVKSYNQGPGNTNKEKSGKIKKGYADEYWERFQRNYKLVEKGI